MRKLLILILSIIISNPCLAGCFIDIYEQRNIEAEKILYEYIKETTPLGFMELANITQESCLAVFYDLNSDGVNEVLGMVESSAYCGTAGYSLFILEKEKNKYKNKTYIINFYPNFGLRILDTKSSGYSDIQIMGLKRETPFPIKYVEKYGFYGCRFLTE